MFSLSNSSLGARIWDTGGFTLAQTKIDRRCSRPDGNRNATRPQDRILSLLNPIEPRLNQNALRRDVLSRGLGERKLDVGAFCKPATGAEERFGHNAAIALGPVRRVGEFDGVVSGRALIAQSPDDARGRSLDNEP